MTARTSIDVLPDGRVLKIWGRFDLHAYRAFHLAARRLMADCAGRDVAIDISEVNYIDSSALGMLLVLREQAAERGVAVALGPAKPCIQRVLRMALLHQLFPLWRPTD